VLWGEVAAAAAGHRLRGLPSPPIIILTFSADRAQFGAKINSYWFIAKADISSTVIASLVGTRDRPDRILTLRKAVPPTTMNAQPLLDMGSCGLLFPQQIGERDNEGIILITDNLCVAFAPDGIRVNERVIGVRLRQQ
jgi:hypothetical protein